ncbi:retrovirus-related pol polyprotein from transposon TNT 1-94 [Tanacetum coccineum]
MTPQSQAEFPQLDSGLAVPMFQQGEDPIECINKAMAFLSAIALRFPPSNNQLRTSANPRNQATIQDGRVTVQQVQGRQHQSYASTRNRGIATTSKGNVAAGQPRVVKCYNCQGEWHMVRQCTQPKRSRNAAWFKEKLMLAKAQEAGQILDEEQLAFLADPGISEALVAQQTIPQNSAFPIDDLDAYDSNCDDLSSAKAVLMANLSSCDPEVHFEVPYFVSYPNDMINQDVQEM